MMEYKGYTGRITCVDEEQGLLHGEVADLTDVITFEGRTVEELAKAFRESVDDYLEFCKEKDEAPDRPFSGKFVVRVSPELHRKASLAARRARQSLNALVTTALEDYLGRLAAGRPEHGEGVKVKPDIDPLATSLRTAYFQRCFAHFSPELPRRHSPAEEFDIWLADRFLLAAIEAKETPKEEGEGTSQLSSYLREVLAAFEGRTARAKQIIAALERVESESKPSKPDEGS